MKQKIIKNKNNIIILTILILFSLLILLFVRNDYFMYKKTIIKVTNVKTYGASVSTNTLGLEETHSNQQIKGIILNNKNKGDKVVLTNEITTSSVTTETYKVGDELFIKDKDILGLKRDNYIALMAVMFALLIYIVGQFKGLLSIVTVIGNMTIFYIGLNLYSGGVGLIILCFIESFIFTVFSLLLTSGKNRKTMAAIISVFISIITLFLITLIVIKTTNYSGVNFTGMEFLTIPAEEAFMAELILGGLGAIMDVCVTISSSLAELIEKDKNISHKALANSGKKIGNDIMGTMINVIFFTYLCSGLPIFVLAIRNGFSLRNYVTANFTLEITRFLIGAIGIVLAIPITIYVAPKILKKVKQ